MTLKNENLKKKETITDDYYINKSGTSVVGSSM